MEIVISLLMFLGDPPQLKEHLLMPSISKCLESKRIATRNSNAEYRCMRVNAVVKDGKIISISNIDWWEKDNQEEFTFEFFVAAPYKKKKYRKKKRQRR